MNGKFIVLEGIDGSGKKTMCSHIKEMLIKKGHAVTLFTYPDYGSPWGTIIHQFLTGERDLEVTVQFLTYATDIMKDQDRIKTLLAHQWVVADRYITSTIAFQCARGFPLAKARKFIELFEMVQPDTIFFLDVLPEMGRRRKKRQKGNLDRHETDISFLEKVNEMYVYLMNQAFLTDQWKKIDASRNQQHVVSDIISEIEKLV
jgi:dTMP kinase